MKRNDNAILSASQKGKVMRDTKILYLYNRMRDRYVRAMDLYNEIARRCGCSYNTVISVLQGNGVITPKKERQ